MSREKQIDIIRDLLVEFDEMGFVPSTAVPDHEAYAIKWRSEITKALEDYFKQSGWISVDERLPKNNLARVLVFLKDDEFTRPIGFNKIDTDRCIDGKWARWGKYVTHWMPLPEAPKMKGGVTAESAIKAVQEAAHELKDTPPDDLLGIGSTMQF